MGFSRRELNEDAIQWNRIQAQLESAEDHDPEEPLLVDGLVTQGGKTDDDDDETSSEGELMEELPRPRRQPPRPTRAARTAANRSTKALPKLASPEVAAERLPMIKAAAERVKRLKKMAISPDKKYRKGRTLFDPSVQKFGVVVYSAPGYVRLEMRDGTQSTQGKPPLEDRRNFVIANFDRMDNKTMAEILDISVHTMRRLCHEYGLRRHGRAKATQQLRSA